MMILDSGFLFRATLYIRMRSELHAQRYISPISCLNFAELNIRLRSCSKKGNRHIGWLFGLDQTVLFNKIKHFSLYAQHKSTRNNWRNNCNENHRAERRHSIQYRVLGRRIDASLHVV